MDLNKQRVLVVGAGVAGCACALRLRQHGIAVEIVERHPFPRAKVCGCCLSAAGVSCLAALGLGDWLMNTASPVRRWFGSLGGYAVEVPLRAGVVISRRSLDTEMLRRAERSGAVVHQPCKASIERQDSHSVEVKLVADGSQRQQTFPAVVVAGGLNAPGLGAALPWVERPEGPFGVSMEVEPCPSVEPGTIYMACDDDGYVGVVRMEDGRVDVAAALRSGSQHADQQSAVARMRAMLDRSRLPIRADFGTSQSMTTAPLRRSRLAGQARLLAIGDTAGYVEPFTGEGMTWAIHGGIEAADLIARHRDDLSRIGDAWRKRLEQIQAPRRRRCQVVTTALRSHRSRKWVGAVLANCPMAAVPLVRSFSRPLSIRPVTG